MDQEEHVNSQAEPAEPPSLLTPEGLLVSNLWLDRPDASDEIDRRIRAGSITEEQGENLRTYAVDGYLAFELDLDAKVFGEIEECVDAMWREKPNDVVYAFEGPLRRMTESVEANERKPPYRIMGLETRCPAAMSLYLNQKIFEYLHLIFEERAIATQSIYFQFGSRQGLHRDPVHVYMDPPSHLAAAWIALEDIQPESGPLTYVAGSHKLPYFQFHPGEYRFDHYSHTAEDDRRMAAAEMQQAKDHDLVVQPFLPKAGQVLIWHHSLLHGGSPGSDEITRKSFVVHYTTMQYYTSSKQSLSVPLPNGERNLQIIESHDVMAQDGCYGFKAPILSAP